MAEANAVGLLAVTCAKINPTFLDRGRGVAVDVQQVGQYFYGHANDCPGLSRLEW
jgi:hypothetical protein